MKITNSLGLPEAIVRAVENDPYNKGDAEFSVTELLSPPRQRALRLAHKEELTEDVKDRLWALYGQIAHLILERANMSDLSELRLFGDIDGVRVSGQFDTLCIENGALSDYKFTSVWGFKSNSRPKDEWVSQLNMQLELLRQNGLDAKSLRIVGLLRDWQLNQAKYSSTYPKEPIAIHMIPMWPREKTINFMKQRISLHREAGIHDLPECSREDTWQGKRCENYCNVSGFCVQYQQAKEMTEYEV